MKKISIIKNGEVTNGMEGEDEAALRWLAEHEAARTFGDVETVILEDGSSVTLPVDYEVQIEDTTEIRAKEEAERQERSNKKKAAKEALKAADPDGAKTIADLRKVVKHLVDYIREAHD